MSEHWCAGVGGVHCSQFPPPSLLPAAEIALEKLCWVPFGFQSQSVGPEGGKLSLEPSTGTMRREETESILLEVPPGAVSPSKRVEVRSALIPDGPFTLPDGYQLGSMVMYVYYDSRHVTRPLTFHLPHWYGGEDQVQDGLTFAMAPHTLKEGESVYQFELLERGRMFSGHCGELEFDGHCSLFAEVFKKGAVSCYQAVSLQREKGNETTCDVAVTYAFPQWCDVSAYMHIHTDIQCMCIHDLNLPTEYICIVFVFWTIQILMKYRSDWEVNKHSYPFTFEENKIKGKLRDERGNGWHAAINGPSEVSKLLASSVGSKFKAHFRLQRRVDSGKPVTGS